MKVMYEFFGGSNIMSDTFKYAGFKTESIDNNPVYNPDWCVDVFDVCASDLWLPVDVFWASVPCNRFSVASIGKSWTGGKGAYIPKNEDTRKAVKLLEHTIKLIKQSKSKIWYIENPRGLMRKIAPPILDKYGLKYRIVTITYCQYGDNRMKPTDIITNDFDWKPRPMCKNGDSCHVSAPRGAKTGTQGLKGSYERSKLPVELCNEIVAVNVERFLI